MHITSHKDLIVWKKSVQLVKEVYSLTEKFPQSEIFGLTSQLRRAAVSVPSNIAEGRRRLTKGEFVQFLGIAYASGAEIETQIDICKMLPFGGKLDYTNVDNLLLEIMKMLNKMISSLKAKKLPATS